MNYEEFKECVKERIMEYVTEGGEVCINHVLKNNGKELDGLVIVEKGSNIAPTIYLESYYRQYEDGKSIQEIARDIISVHEQHRTGLNINPEMFNDYTNISSSIVYKVINYDKNRKLLETVPHRKILDLAVVYYCLIEQRDGVNATALIHNEHIRMWNITAETLHEDAVRNTPRLLEGMIRPMGDILRDMIKLSDMESEEKDETERLCDAAAPGEMYVLTNSSKINGAACIFYDKLLEEFAKRMNCDLYILPSSIHEVIILPKHEEYDKSMLINMVREVNSEGVSADEILSDNVYEYNRCDRMICL